MVRILYLTPNNDIKKALIGIEFTGDEFSKFVEQSATYMEDKFPNLKPEDKEKSDKHKSIYDFVNNTLSKLTSV